MAIPTDISLKGYDELLSQFKKMIKFTDDRPYEEGLLDIARKLRNEIRRAAPRSNKWSGSVDVRPGNLRKSIEARKFRRKVRNSPAVYVRSNSKKAPHAHLLEFGTKGLRFPKHKKVLHFLYEGEEIFVPFVAPMPPHPFFRNTVDSNRDKIEKDIVEFTKSMIQYISENK